MKQFSAKQQKWLKCFHLIFAAVWMTCGIVILSFSIAASDLNDGDHLYILNYLTDLVDMKILVPAAMLTLFTGLLYSIFTGWGFFIHRWIIFKWVITVAIIVIGTIFTGPWISEMTEMARNDGIEVLQNPRYIFINKSQFAAGLSMNITLIFTVFVSVLKPWKK